ncbi:MAG: alpha/beta hydrolase fold domain-containing protein [Brachybacterium sp.]|nr:alpha/beta hydrolase fold domain-containing protein [Brachybacterium sp.]
MGRIRRAVTVGVETVRRVPVPSGVYTHALQEARRSMPPGAVQKTHAVDVEMIGRTRCVWLDRHRADRGTVVHLHGGAYVSGPFAGDWEWLSRQADRREGAGLMIDYRGAPDHTHPVALEDAEAVLAALDERGDLTGGYVLTGQNSGGGMALSIARRSPTPPVGLVVMAPWLDLELQATGVTETGRHDFVHERRMLRAAAASYAGRTPLDDPDLSPTNADLSGLPPMHLSVGAKDIFLTDVRVARLQFEEQGVDVRYREVGGRIGSILRMRRGEDMKRLLGEQQQFIRERLD